MQDISSIQYLISQILHDCISPFTSLSAGIDFIALPPGEIGSLIHLAKDQLQSCLTLYRFIFSHGEGTIKESAQLIHQYGEAFQIQIQGTVMQFPKLTAALVLWLTKQCMQRNQAIIYLEPVLQLQGSLIKPSLSDEQVLQKGAQSVQLKDSFAHYIHQLLLAHHQTLTLERHTDTLQLILTQF
jgi:hypothetical protein